MRNTRNCTRLQLVRALALMMCLLLGGLAEADDLAADLGGDYGAAGQPNDIASDLGISRVAVYKHLNKALKILKKQFTWKD